MRVLSVLAMLLVVVPASAAPPTATEGTQICKGIAESCTTVCYQGFALTGFAITQATVDTWATCRTGCDTDLAACLLKVADAKTRGLLQ